MRIRLKTGFLVMTLMALSLAGCGSQGARTTHDTEERVVDDPDEESEPEENEEETSEDTGTDDKTDNKEIKYEAGETDQIVFYINVSADGVWEINSALFRGKVDTYCQNTSLALHANRTIGDKTVEYSDDAASKIAMIESDLYKTIFAHNEDAILDSYEILAQSYVDQKGYGEEIRTTLKPVDMKDKILDHISYNFHGTMIEAPVLKCEAYAVLTGTFQKGDVEPVVPTYALEHDPDRQTWLYSFSIEIDVPKDSLSPLFKYFDELVGESVQDSDTDMQAEKPVADTDKSKKDKTDTGIIGKWYPEHTSFSVYYMQIDEGGTGTIHCDDEKFTLTYTYADDVLDISISGSGTRTFYHEGDVLLADEDGSTWHKNDKSDASTPAKESKEKADTSELIGIWYDETGIDYAEYDIRADGTGVETIGSNTSIALRWTFSGGALSITTKYGTESFAYAGGKLYASTNGVYVKK